MKIVYWCAILCECVWATVIVVSEGWRVLFMACGLCVLVGIRLQAGKEVKRNRILHTPPQQKGIRK